MTWEMMPVDTKHSLEMQTKMYQYPPHITVIQEIIANANDAFEQSNMKKGTVEISLIKDSKNGYIIFHNNADPIPRSFFEKDYQTLFKSSKTIGSGIGFVGIGAKIFLASPHGGEIITITGKKDIMAARWRWSEQGPQYITSLKQPMSEVVDLKKFSHTNGTTFICRLSLEKYSELKNDLENIIKFWWNYALLTNLFEIKVNGKTLTPDVPKGSKKIPRKFRIGGKDINCIYWISETEVPEDYQNIIYVVHGKRIEHDTLDTSLQVKGNYGKRIFCYVNVPMLGKYVTTSKEHFDKDKIVTKIKNRIKEDFWKFIEEQGLLKSNTKDFTKNIELDRLTEKLNRALQSSKFNDVNPFLAKREREIPVENKDGAELLSESTGFQKTGKDAKHSGPGGTVGDESGKSNVFDQKGSKLGEIQIRHSRGFNIGEIEHDESEKKEAYVSIAEKAVIINIGHPFYKKIQNSSLSEFHKYKIVIEALIRFQVESEGWSVEQALDKSRDLLHSIWD